MNEGKMVDLEGWARELCGWGETAHPAQGQCGFCNRAILVLRDVERDTMRRCAKIARHFVGGDVIAEAIRTEFLPEPTASAPTQPASR